MKFIFVLLMFLVLATFPLGIKRLFIRKDSLLRRMFYVLLVASISLVSHVIVVLTQNETVATVAYAFYFSSATWISVFVFDVCGYYVGSKSAYNIVKFCIIPIAIIDNLAVFANIFYPFMYDVYFTRWFGDFYLHYRGTVFLLLHVLFGHALFIYSFVILLGRILKEPPTFRIKYYSLLTFIFLILISNIIYVLTAFPFNFSILVYAACFIASYQVLVNVLPNRVIQKTLGLIAGNLKNGIILLDNNNKCLYVNSFVHDVFECDTKSILNHDVMQEFIRQKELSGAEKESSFSKEIDFQTKDKRLVLQLSDYFIKECDVTIGHYYLIEDVTESKNQVYEEKMLRTRDKLTGLYNQDYFFEKVEHRIKFDRFTTYCIIVTDLVNFKLINDLHGKPFGDTILLRLADSIRSHAAPDDIYGRLFNDHFVMFVPKRHFDEKAYIEAFQNKMSYLHNFSYNLIGHMGVYEVDDLSLPVSIMCDRAFLALHSIKSDYKIRVAYYDDTLRQEVLKMQMLMNELPQALKNGQLVMYLQPQVKKDGELVGAEALVRWHHPTRGVIPPSDFIEIIEKINIISDVDRYVWECACAKLAGWKRIGREDLTISVNISANDFFTMDLYETFTQLVKKYDVSPRNLNLEITETAVIFDLENQERLLDRLRSAGFIVEMDDFGSGYSSLNMLKDISVDVLKIDMAFLQKSKNDGKNRIILEKIIMLAKELGMHVITEGVENDSQISFLSDAGCDLFQGFYFSRPVPIDDFEEKYFKR